MDAGVRLCATVLMTMFSVVLAVLSLMLPWYQVTELWVDDHSNVQQDTVEFFPTYFDDPDLGIRNYDFMSVYLNVGGLLGMMMIMIIMWFLVALLYVGRVVLSNGSPLHPADGFFLGWVLVVISLVTVVLFAVNIAGSYNADQESWEHAPNSISSFIGFDGVSEWGPMMGWYVAVTACVFQVTAVLTWNLPTLLRRYESHNEQPREEPTYEDLPPQ